MGCVGKSTATENAGCGYAAVEELVRGLPVEGRQSREAIAVRTCERAWWVEALATRPAI